MREWTAERHAMAKSWAQDHVDDVPGAGRYLLDALAEIEWLQHQFTAERQPPVSCLKCNKFMVMVECVVRRGERDEVVYRSRDFVVFACTCGNVTIAKRAW